GHVRACRLRERAASGPGRPQALERGRGPMSEVVHSFTATIPTWSPYVTPVELASATSEQLAAMKVTPSNKGVSPYVLTLAHDPESLAVRSPLFNLIMYGKDGLSPAERELGALSASVVNRCIYCAAVHAS